MLRKPTLKNIYEAALPGSPPSRPIFRIPSADFNFEPNGSVPTPREHSGRIAGCPGAKKHPHGAIFRIQCARTY